MRYRTSAGAGWRGPLSHKRTAVYRTQKIATTDGGNYIVPTSGSADNGNAMNFKLNEINSTMLTNLVARWNRYRIRGVKVEFFGPNASTQQTVGQYYTPSIVITNVTFQTPVAPSLAVINAKESSVMRAFHGYASVYIPWPVAYSSIITTGSTTVAGGQVPKGSWLDISQTGVEHYGLEWQFPSFNTTNQWDISNAKIQYFKTYYLEFMGEK